jgi:P-type Cu2+ transporter
MPKTQLPLCPMPGSAFICCQANASDAAYRVAEKLGITNVKGNCSPKDKLDFLRQSQAQGRKIAVVGDGLNDGPVLAGAHVSFAFGQAVPLAQAQADFLVSGSRLTHVADALLLSRRTLGIVRQNLCWSAIYNAVCVPLAVFGLLPAWLAGLGMASSSLLVVLNALRLSKDAQFERKA